MSARKRNRKYDDRKLEWLRDGKFFVVILVLAVIVFRFIIGVSWVDGQSMFPTLHNSQPVVYNRLAKEFKYGDIVSVRFPNGQYMIKRVIGTAGDTVDLKDGVVYINGKPEALAGKFGRTDPQEGTIDYPFTLGEDKLFVLGDNREKSVDSRTYGILSETSVRGKVFFYKDHN